jgi:hypothetical protein
VERIEVRQGDTIDLAVDCRGNPNYDGFSWTVDLRRVPPVDDATNHWSSKDDFRGPPADALDPWTRLAQVLLMSNEFMFVD